MSAFRRLVLVAAFLAYVVVVVGAYVRLHDAGLGCPDWPGCYGRLVGVPHGTHEVAQAERSYGQAVDSGRAWKEMFHRYLGSTASGDELPGEALTAIQWAHRAGALATLAYVGALAFTLVRKPGLAMHGVFLFAILLAQIGLGVANVLLRLPLAVAVAHNGAAALLLVSLVMLNFTLFRRSER